MPNRFQELCCQTYLISVNPTYRLWESPHCYERVSARFTFSPGSIVLCYESDENNEQEG